MDVLAVREACRFAKEYTTSGKGPLVMEMVTYRYGGHSMSDPGTTYRTREEIQNMRSSSDPITGFKERLISKNVATESELKEIEMEARKLIDEAVEEAKNSPVPQVAELWTDIYCKISLLRSIAIPSESSF
jgi:pyruvate dehydrogenase E1 component alpha subunit